MPSLLPPLRRALARTLVLGLAAVPLATVADLPGPSPDPTVHRVEVPIADGALADGPLRLDLDGGPEMVGLTWDPPADGSFEVRARDGDGWTRWYALVGHPDEGPDEGSSEGRPGGSAGPAFLGRDIREVEVRAVGSAPRGIVLHAIDTEPVATDGVASAAVATPPSMITRSQWGADESWRDDSGGECDGTPDYVDDIKIGYVHHTVSRNDYTPQESAALLRGIYDFHVHSNGWCDVGYNFLVDRHGQVFEGRYGGIRRAVIGGHASGFNSVSTGVAVIGDFSSTPVPQAAYDALVEVLAFKLGYHGVDPRGSSTVTVGTNSSAKWPPGTSRTVPNLLGHRDTNNTSCPGQHLYDRLGALRNDVANLISTRGYEAAFTLDRIAGSSRFDTAAAIAKATFPSADEAYLARGDGAFADALAAGFLAGVDSAPVLLALADDVPDVTMGTLRSLGVDTVHVLGGSGAFTGAVDDELRGAGYAVDRIAGADRFETAAAVARTGAGAVGTDPDSRRVAVLSSGMAFPDALASGGIVAGMRFPQLLAPREELPASTAAALRDLGIQHVLVTGGDQALSAAVEQQVQALGITTERIAGTTRWDTAVALADLAVDRFGFSSTHVELATGDAFPDALAAGPHAGARRAPILLAARYALHGEVCPWLQRRGPAVSGGHVFGGQGAVDAIAKITAEECLKPPG